MKLRLHVSTGLVQFLGVVLALVGTVGSTTIAAEDASGWKIAPNPDIVNFKRVDAEVVT